MGVNWFFFGAFNVKRYWFIMRFKTLVSSGMSRQFIMLVITYLRVPMFKVFSIDV